MFEVKQEIARTVEDELEKVRQRTSRAQSGLRWFFVV